jgi:hypothetical protein
MINANRFAIALALVPCALACTPSVPSSPSPASVTTALFDPTKSQIPLPNDLLLGQDPSKLGLPAAEAELIGVFQKQGGFPNDQEVAVTVDFAQNNIDPDTGAVTQTAPDLDLSTFTPATYFMAASTDASLSGAGIIQLAPIAATDYVKYATYGELTFHNLNHAPWVPGEYSLFIRGGANGVKTTSGDPIAASSVFYLIEQEKDLTSAANIGLLEAQLGSLAAAEAAAVQLNQIIASYKPAFALADKFFPHTELAVLDTFRIAPLVTQVELDPNRGLVPLPIDLLRNPGPTGKLTAQGSCGLASGKLDASGTCRLSSGAVDGLAAGFAALDGFSTTGAILASTSGLLTASTITPSSVLLFDLTNPAAPALVNPSTYITEPGEVQSQGFSPVIDLQPAGATASDPTSVFRTKPLKDATNYAVVITTGVKDKSGKPLGRGTVASILLFDNALVAGAANTSQLTGIPDATAGALEVMREELLPVVSAAGSLGVSKSQIAMAYTFRTQTILSQAVQLGALPYQAGAEVAAGSTDPTTVALAHALAGPVSPIVSSTPAAAFAKYGLDTSVTGNGVPLVPSSNINEVLETNIETINLLNPASGAFLADPTKASLETIKVLIATPKPTNPNLTACTGALMALGNAGVRCAPLVVFRHGLGSGRAAMLTLADSFVAQGMVVVAIDAAKHGDRSFCAKDSDCVSGACTHDPAMAGQGDAPGAGPGTCSAGFRTHPVDCPTGAAQCSSPTDGVPYASSNFLISANFFRTRDTLRQDILDQSQLIHAIAIAPTAAFPTDNALETHLAQPANGGLIIDPTRVYFVGQSLGSIQGTADVAANPRISKATLNVGGGTIVDVFTNSPAFAPQTNLLLLSIGVVPGTASYLQFLTVAKTILDPADPLNFAGHLTANTLPNLLASPTMPPPQAAKKILTQIAYCDQTVPNPFNYLLAENVPTSPLPGAPGFGATAGTSEIFVANQTNFTDCPVFGGAALPPAAVDHAFITSWTPVTSQATGAKYILTEKAQADAAAFVAKDTLPPSVQTPAP